jgi:hypothetical protein
MDRTGLVYDLHFIEFASVEALSFFMQPRVAADTCAKAAKICCRGLSRSSSVAKKNGARRRRFSHLKG